MLKKICSLLLVAVFAFSVFVPAFCSSAAEVDNAIVVAPLSSDGNVTVCLKPSENIKNVKGLQFGVTLPEGFIIQSVESKLDSVWEVYNNTKYSRFLIYNQTGATIEDTEVAENGLYELFTLNCTLSTVFTSGDILTANIKVGDITTENNVANLGELTTDCDFVFVDTAFSTDEFTYTVDAGKATITRYIGSGTDVEIPETIGEYPVSAIGKEAFILSPTLANVTIPNSVTQISNDAFSGCTALTIHGEKDSYAETFATDNTIPFIPLTNYYTINFIAPSGANLYELKVAEGESLADYYNEIANIVVPDIYGYDKQIVDGLQMWSKDAYSDMPIFANDTFYPSYLRRTDITIEILVNGVNGNTLLSTTLPYDVAFTATDKLANSWLMDGAVVDTGDTVKLYACGASMIVNASENTTNANNLSVVGTVLENNKLMVFAHGEIEGISEYGVIFTSKGLGETLTEETFTFETAQENIPLKKAQITSKLAAANTTEIDFVGTLNIKSGATRYARAYVKSGSTYYYSNIIVATN